MSNHRPTSDPAPYFPACRNEGLDRGSKRVPSYRNSSIKIGGITACKEPVASCCKDLENPT